MTKKFDQWLLSTRLKRGLTQKQAAKQLGVNSQAMLSRWENGLSLPSVNYLLSLAKWGKITADQLIRMLAT